ncbi:MAG: hypothetical protein M3541_10890 [Acidobacteriota bacterium]|nr:hypothetical protein [Acidobacteriota bacterium]
MAILLYSGSLRAGFVADDWDFLALVGQARSAAIAFEPLVGRFFRPWVVLLYYVNYKAFGEWPLPFHLTVVLLHALNAWLLCLFTLRITKGDRVLALLTGALFLAFAGHSEAVSWIAGTADTILMSFAIGGLLLLHRALTSGSPLLPTVTGWLVLAAGIMAKETSVMLPALAAAYGTAFALSVTGEERRAAFVKTARFVVVPALIVAGYLALRTTLFGDPTDAYAGLSLSAGTVFTYARAFVLRIFFPPWGRLAIAWGHGQDVWLLGAGLVVLVIALMRAHHRVPLLFSGAAAAIMLAPALPLTISLSTTETERVVYIPTAFGALLTVLTLDALLRRRSLRNMVAAALIFAHGLVLQRFTTNWREAGESFAQILDSFTVAARSHDPGADGHFFILNLPDNLRGAYIFRRGFYIALARQAPELARRESFITGISSHTIHRREDRITAAQLGPASFSLDVAPNVFLQRAPPTTPFFDFLEWTPQGFRLRFTPVVRHAVVFSMTEGRIEFSGRISGGGSPFGVLELPVDSTPCNDTLRVSGWTLDDVAVDEVTIRRRGGQELGKGTFIPNQRRDVISVYPGYPRGHLAGWEYLLPCAELKQESEVIEVIATDGAGNATVLGTRTVRRAHER